MIFTFLLSKVLLFHSIPFWVLHSSPFSYNAFPLISIIFHMFEIFHISNFTFFNFSTFPIFLIFFHFTLLHIKVFILSSYSIPPLVPYFIPPHFTIFRSSTSFLPHIKIFRNFPSRTSSVPLQLYSLYLTSQLYTFFPVSSFFNLLSALNIFSLQCPIRGLVPSLSNSSSSLYFF